MIERFLLAHNGPGTAIGEGALQRFALQAFLSGRLDAAALRQERMVAGDRPTGLRLVVMGLLARLQAGYPRATGLELVAEIESIFEQVPDLVPAGFDASAHRQLLLATRSEITLQIRATLAALEVDSSGHLPLLGPGDRDPLPLVCHQAGSFAFARLYAAEQDLMESVAQRASRLSEFGTEVVARAMAVVDGLPGHALHVVQRQAVEAALRHPFLVLTGGPGTGKTTVVSRVLLALAHCLPDFDAESVALCAPTGRAKARLAESLCQNLAPLTAADRHALALVSLRASTLHALIGMRPDGSFRHHAQNPLPHRVVVLDEASMVDLPLFSAFLEALSPSTRLVVVGDPDQLPSVEAGAVLSDLVANPYLQGLRVHLLHTHRNAGEIAAICQAVRDGGDVPFYLASRCAKMAEVETARHRIGSVVQLRGDALEAMLPIWLEQRFGQVMRGAQGGGFGDPLVLLPLVERSRILCVVHEGKSGAQTINRLADLWLRSSFPSSWRGPFVPGQQVILTHNHPLRDLWNGDLGVVVEHDQRLVAAFPKSDGVLTVPVEQLDGLESAWAITVHKAQGSEFEEILFALPDRDVPILTRQILYTALSRARRTVLVHGDLDLVGRAIARSADRPSRLREVRPRE